jgi:hypothetical protein
MDWISVKDRLPEEDDDYLVYGEDHRGFIFTGCDWFVVDCKDWWNNPHGQVTHWMPLPEPPEDNND